MRFAILLFVILLTSNVNLVGQSEHFKNIAIVKPKIKSTHIYAKLDKYLYPLLQETVAKNSQITHLIDREEFENIEKASSYFTRANGTVGSAKLQGIEYLLETRVVDYKEKISEVCKKVEVKSKRKDKTGKYPTKVVNKCAYIVLDTEITISFQVVSVETGEVEAERTLIARGGGFMDHKPKPQDYDLKYLRVEAFKNLKSCLVKLWNRNMMGLITPSIEVLKITEEKNSEAKKLMIRGGHRANHLKKFKLIVVRKYEEEINGQKIQREEKIGDGVIEDKMFYHSIFKVKSGKKRIYEALKNNERVYCINDRNLKYDQCRPFDKSGLREKIK